MSLPLKRPTPPPAIYRWRFFYCLCSDAFIIPQRFHFNPDPSAFAKAMAGLRSTYYGTVR